MGDENSFDRGKVDPSFEKDGTDGVEYDDDGGEFCGGCFDKVVTFVPGVQTVGASIAVVSFDGSRVFTRVAGNENECNV